MSSAADVPWARLLNPEPENWLMYSGNLSGWRYSALDTINKDNAKNLVVKYIFALTGESADSNLTARQESIILADKGTIFTADGLDRVYAFDASSGNKAVPLWSYDPAITKSRTTRGLALFDDGAFISTNDTRMIRLNSNTGESVWETVATAKPIPEYGTPSAKTQGFTTEPFIVHTKGGKDLVVQGESTGGQSGTISYVVALDAKSGEIAWRRFTVPFPGEPGHETWADDHDAWKTGGAGVWSHATFDPATNLIYHGTGDIFPTYDPEFRPGDNLFGSSTIALDADTGKIQWYHQMVPNESWDYDQPSTRMLYDGKDGTPEAGVFARSGHYYTYNRGSGEVLGVFQYERATWTKGIDAKTGLPVDYVPGAGVQRYAQGSPTRGKLVEEACPTASGSAMGLNPPSFDPKQRFAYMQVTESCYGATTLTKWADDVAAKASAGLSRIGAGAGTTLDRAKPSQPNVYTIYAYNVDDGKKVASYEDPNITTNISTGVLTTAGGLAIAGSETGEVEILDSTTLKPLYTFNVGAELASPFSTWSVDGKQYIGTTVGGDGEGNLKQTAIGIVFGLPD